MFLTARPTEKIVRQFSFQMTGFKFKMNFGRMNVESINLVK